MNTCQDNWIVSSGADTTLVRCETVTTWCRLQLQQNAWFSHTTLDDQKRSCLSVNLFAIGHCRLLSFITFHCQLLSFITILWRSLSSVLFYMFIVHSFQSFIFLYSFLLAKFRVFHLNMIVCSIYYCSRSTLFFIRYYYNFILKYSILLFILLFMFL